MSVATTCLSSPSVQLELTSNCLLGMKVTVPPPVPNPSDHNPTVENDSPERLVHDRA